MCGQLKDEQRAQYLRAVFDTIPMPSFIVDEDCRIQDFNAAAERFLGSESASALYCRGGEAFACIHAGRDGCGKAEACSKCVIRQSVNRAMKGKATCREAHQAELRTSKGTTSIDLLVTTSLLPYTEKPRALLILEDVGAILKLHRNGEGPRRRGSVARAR
jgi:PAS domain-containing protein